ncbi:GGDEF domain-containing protein [Phycisphaerales bacterium AB-hyl4]|uniref:diguanylate cyclase n=1 Tax=Natronomicrosphaera hydrolytica TaxID=3242702 RepID=A0ABV4U0L1_9BACT
MSTGHDNTADASTSHSATDRSAPRVIVVDPALAEQLNDELVSQCLPGSQVCAVPTFLNALGELARGPAAAVLVPARAMAGMVAAGAKTMRRMAPDAKLLVVADDTGRAEAERAIEHGFDALVPEPITHPTLHTAWHGTPPASPSPQAEAASGAAATATADQTSKSQAPSADAALEDAELGDVDLVEAILNGQDLLRRTALRLVAARSGITNLGWADPGEDVPAEHVSSAVTCRDHRFGLLHAPAPTPQDHLDGWAAWLGRWLTLERQVRQLEELSMKDELTGIWNRRYFNRFLKHVVDRSARDRSQVTLLVFDIDDFKIYNDRYGHAAGDEILRETARLMQSSVREHDVVARIGGDEFAVIFWDADEKRRPDSHHPESVRAAATRFQQAILQHRFPKLLNEAPGSLTISGGLASFPWDGRTPEELTDKADQIAMQAKRQGKNAITFGPGALRSGEA